MTKDEVLKQSLEALEEMLAAQRATNRPPETVMQAEEKLDRIRKAAQQCVSTIAVIKQVMEQPEPETVAWTDEQGNVRMTFGSGDIQSSVGYVYSVHGERIKNACIKSDIPNGTPLFTSPPKRERNFCERCGKRLSKDHDHIHTCTPPEDGIKGEA